MRRMKAGILTTVTMVTLAGVGTVAPAAAGSLNCGDTITQSTVLTADLASCFNYGLIIGANNITLDLNGHTISGNALSNDKAGVYLLNRTGVTVKNGTVTDFDIGVAIEGGSGNTVEGITARHNIGGGGGIGGDGIAILSSLSNVVRNNQAIDNGPFSGIGVYSRIDGDHPRTVGGPARFNRIEGNRSEGNIISRDRTSPLNTDNDGIRVENDAANNSFLNNQVLNNGLDGIALFAVTFDNVVRGNVVQHNGFYRTTARRGSGIIVFSGARRNVIEYNLSIGNADSGVDIRQPAGIQPGAQDNRIVGNTAFGNSARPFIPSPVFGPSFDLKDGNLNPPCDNNFWFANRYRTFNQPCVTNGGQQI